ncbi:protein-disulfide reductase DsbD family protein [Pelagibacteraceae bacterium]|nr:protein-disulfide reductase DsbD family protein [Pelagibacteraceae bacterium]
MSKAFNLIKILIFPTLLLFFTTFSNQILALSSEWVINDKSKVRLISAKKSIDNTDEIILGLEYQLEPGWKTYWKSPGGGGFPQKIIWNNSVNIKDIIIDWPTPEDFEILGLTSLGYEEKVIFPLTVKLKDPNKLTEINLNTNYLVCKDICIPGNANLFLQIKPGNGEFSEFFHEIEKIRSTLPIQDIKISSLIKLDTKIKKYSDKIEINIIAESSKSFINTNIFLHTPFGLPVVKSLNNYSFNLNKINSSFTYNADQFSKDSFPLEVLLYDKNHNFNFVKNVSIEDNLTNINNSIIFIFFISILGGFILNLMPCVFPVLSIKLLSILNSERNNIRLSFFYTAFGIVSSFSLLALFFVLFKQIGISVSWGMQFQEPYFLIFILLVLTFFCLNTLGIFEINLPNIFKNSNIYNIGNNFFTKNFFNGFFATLLATPCTAPFVGSALTIAFTQTSTILFIIFILMGIGMSLPYLVVAIFPQSISLLPRSGKWTIYVKYFLSFLLLATIIWVLNILYNFYNYFFIIVFILITLSLFLAFAFNFFKIYISTFSIFILLLIPLLSFFDQNKNLKAYKGWLNFNEIKLDQMINNNEVLFIDVTADWCVTCQFNKVNILEKENIKILFKKNDIKLIRADWTKPDKNIDNFLKKFNKFGIPFNIFFSSKYPDGIILSEILTEKEIIQAINKIQ